MSGNSSLALGGLASGLDTSQIVSGLVAVADVPITNMKAQQTQIASQQTAIGTLTTLLNTLDTDAKNLSNPADVQSTSASSSDTSTVGATATSGGSQGSYDVVVGQLATASRTYSDPVASQNESGLFGTGSFTVAVGSGSPVTINVGADDTLTSVAQEINQNVPGASANIFYDGSQYRLQISATATGTANGLSFSESGTTLGLSDSANQAVTAANAEFSVDGYPVTSATNQVSTAISGVTLSLNAVSSGASYDSTTNTISGGTPTTVTVANDPSSMTTQINQFVNDYNAVVKQVASINGTGANSVDFAVQDVQTRLQNILGSQVSGLSSSLNTLSEIGITTNEDGTLAVNATTLSNQLSTNASGVAGLFEKAGGITGIGSQVDSAISNMVDAYTGTLTYDTKALTAQNNDLTNQITQQQAYVTAYQAQLQAEFNAMEQTISELNGDNSALAALTGTSTTTSSSTSAESTASSNSSSGSTSTSST